MGMYYLKIQTPGDEHSWMINWPWLPRKGDMIRVMSSNGQEYMPVFLTVRCTYHDVPDERIVVCVEKANLGEGFVPC